MRQVAKLFHIAMVILGTLSCSDSDNLVKEPFVGHWIISEALRDGFPHNYWNGLILEIDQTDEDGGVYRMMNSPYDSIWNRSGSWNKMDLPGTFTREDRIDIRFERIDNQLRLRFLIASKETTCTESYCLPIVKGQWVFIAEKTNR